MFILIIIYILHLFINQISFFLSNIYFTFFTLIGKTIHAVTLHIEDFYKNNPQFKEKIVFEHHLLKKEVMLVSSSQRLLKSQLKNKGNKKLYTFIQKLWAVCLYLIFMPNKEEIKRYLSHRFSTIKGYIYKIKNHGIFSLFPKELYKRIPHNKKPLEVVRLIWDIHDNNPAWGRFKIAFQAFLVNVVVSPSTVRNYLNQPKPPGLKKRSYKKVYEDSLNADSNKKITSKYPNHVWNADFTTVKLLFIYVYVFFVIDIYSRKLIYFDIHFKEPTSFWTIQRFKSACSETWDSPKHLITDNGSQFKSDEFKNFCEDYNINHRTGKVHSPRSTAHIERFNQTIKYEVLNYIPFWSQKYLRKIIKQFIDYYNNYRPHMSLNGLTPQMKYDGIEKPPDYQNKVIKRKTFCDNLITFYYLEEAA